MTLRRFFLYLSVLAILPAAACVTNPPARDDIRPTDLTFSQMQPMTLNVGSIQISDQTPQNTKLISPQVMPAKALENYARKRMKSVGGEGVLNFVVQQASITSAEAAVAEGWQGALQISPSMEYTVNMRIGLDLINRATLPNMQSAYSLERKKTIPAGISLAERDRQLNRFIEQMVRDVDVSIQNGLRNNLRLVVEPGPITFGTPTSLGSQGQMVVQPGPNETSPVTITGTMN